MGHVRFVANSAHEAMNHVRELEQRPQSDWSDWSLLDHEEFQELKARVEALEAGSSGAPVFGSNLAGQLVDAASQEFGERLANLEAKVFNLEANMPMEQAGAGVWSEVRATDKSVVSSKLVANLGPLTDEKDAFRQWDEKMVNVLSHLRAGYRSERAHV